jgi:hypothetical protein
MSTPRSVLGRLHHIVGELGTSGLIAPDTAGHSPLAAGVEHDALMEPLPTSTAGPESRTAPPSRWRRDLADAPIEAVRSSALPGFAPGTTSPPGTGHEVT